MPQDQRTASDGLAPSTNAWAEVTGQGPLSGTRRDLLKVAGFSLAALSLPGCSRGQEHDALPLESGLPELRPGRALWFATLCQGCEAGCGILGKSREGRPIKVEGNPEHPLSKGRTCAIGQAQVLPLYDSARLAAPLSQGKPISWESADALISERLAAVAGAKGAVRVLTGTVNGPTRRKVISTFLSGFSDGRHVSYDALSASAALDAHQDLFGVRHLPRVHLDKARVIAAIDADFLGAGVSPVEHTRGWTEGRALSGPSSTFSRHVQIESRLSLTGASADERVVRAPFELPGAVATLAEQVAALRGVKVPWTPEAGEVDPELLALAKDLHTAPAGTALVLCGLNDLQAQRVVAWLNHLLGAYGFTLDLERPSFQRLGDDRALLALREEMSQGKVAALIVAGCNPLYDLAEAAAWAEALARVGLVISLSDLVDETSSKAHFVCPDTHAFARWDDAEPVAGLVTLGQPLLTALGRGRPSVVSLAQWSGKPASDRELLQSAWRTEVHPASGSKLNFDAWFAQVVHDGFASTAQGLLGLGVAAGNQPDVKTLTQRPAGAAPAAGQLALLLHPSLALLDGRHAHNPWLQELPDPITKVSWDNVAALSPATAKALGVKKGDLVRLSGAVPSHSGAPVELPVIVQPGQHDGVVSVALGYGRMGTDRFAEVGPQWIQSEPTVNEGSTVGQRALRLVGAGPAGAAVTVTALGRSHPIATSQLYDSLTLPPHLAPQGGERRPHVQEATVSQWREDPKAGQHRAHPSGELWNDDHPYTGHHWAMAVDLTRCTGCSACVVACQAENNIPVVGRDEMRRQRSMQWMRVDRYYEEEGERVRTAHQPMLCQHCDNAPCETVCPVLATVHSAEGLNQQVYNRCVGTRYCSNNCPYKVRRFNWFDYEHDDEMENLVLNPDVTVRTRGVMEKCSFCVQRIEDARIQARLAGQPIPDGAVVPACSQACPANAIVFGDRNNAESAIAAMRSDPRHYHVLEELNVRPSVGYLTKVRNVEPDRLGERHG